MSFILGQMNYKCPKEIGRGDFFKKNWKEK
jgi:hypothetical protein